MNSIKVADLENKRILIRVDYNEPLKNEKVQSTFRVKSSLKTIRYLNQHQASEIILISHLGRPEGKIDPTLSKCTRKRGKGDHCP